MCAVLRGAAAVSRTVSSGTSLDPAATQPAQELLRVRGPQLSDPPNRPAAGVRAAWPGRLHLDPSQGPHVLIGNLDRRRAVSGLIRRNGRPSPPMQQSLSHLSRDTGNSSVIDGERAARHQIAQLSSERARIHH